MLCRTCHHEHPEDPAAESPDGRPYSDPNFCIARLSEKLSAADLQIEEMKKNACPNAAFHELAGICTKTPVFCEGCALSAKRVADGMIASRDEKLKESNRLNGEYLKALQEIKRLHDSRGNTDNRTLVCLMSEVAEKALSEKRKVSPQNCGCGIDSCMLEFHRADCPLRLPVPPPLTVDTVVPDGKCWLCGRAATGKKGAEPRCEMHL